MEQVAVKDACSSLISGLVRKSLSIRMPQFRKTIRVVSANKRSLDGLSANNIAFTGGASTRDDGATLWETAIAGQSFTKLSRANYFEVHIKSMHEIYYEIKFVDKAKYFCHRGYLRQLSIFSFQCNHRLTTIIQYFPIKTGKISNASFGAVNVEWF